MFGTGQRLSLHALGFVNPPSHMLDDVIAELGAFDLGRAFHQAREIVGDAFAGDGAV